MFIRSRAHFPKVTFENSPRVPPPSTILARVCLLSTRRRRLATLFETSVESRSHPSTAPSWVRTWTSYPIRARGFLYRGAAITSLFFILKFRSRLKSSLRKTNKTAIRHSTLRLKGKEKFITCRDSDLYIVKNMFILIFFAHVPNGLKILFKSNSFSSRITLTY